MTIEERAELGAELKRKCNCCQAALLALNDQTGLSDEQIMHLGSGFGSGMGNMEGTCGAIVGAGLVLGLSGASTRQMRQVMNKFQERNGATQCKLLKGIGTGNVLRECSDCVADAAEFLEEQIG